MSFVSIIHMHFQPVITQQIVLLSSNLINPIYLVVVMDFLKTNDASTDENLGKLVDPRHYSFVIVSMVDLPIL